MSSNTNNDKKGSAGASGGVSDLFMKKKTQQKNTKQPAKQAPKAT
jgi:hypothetical protein